MISDAISVPSLVLVDEISPVPNSHDIPFHTEWQKDWFDVVMEDAIAHWRA